MVAKRFLATVAAKKTVHYLENDPVQHFDKIIKVGRKISKDDPFYNRVLDTFEKFWHQDQGPWKAYLMKYLTELDKKQREKFVVNFLVNDGVYGYTLQLKNAEKYGCNIPWAILMDPTTACNLKCTGCWAAEYEKHENLPIEVMDKLIRQAKKLGCYFFLFSGGEPLVRKADIIKLCEMHQDCMFTAFTNGTLIDEKFVQEIKRVGNFIPALSIEGFEEETDMRRGNGTYQKVIHAMDLLREAHLAFGFSCCYHSKNTDSVASDEFIDFMIEKGAWFGWYFTFIPVGTNAPVELVATPDQREYMYHRIRKIRSEKPIFLMDFWNDGEYSGGCVAGGRRYFHVNASGDAEPCAFIHYSTCNVKNTSLMNILKSPLFMQYHDHQPFNANMLRPCPMLDNPEYIQNMVKDSGARSTQILDPEKAEDLAAKCKAPSEAWAPRAEKLWYSDHCKECKNEACHYIEKPKEKTAV